MKRFIVNRYTVWLLLNAVLIGLIALALELDHDEKNGAAASPTTVSIHADEGQDGGTSYSNEDEEGDDEASEGASKDQLVDPDQPTQKESERDETENTNTIANGNGHVNSDSQEIIDSDSIEQDSVSSNIDPKGNKQLNIQLQDLEFPHPELEELVLDILTSAEDARGVSFDEYPYIKFQSKESLLLEYENTTSSEPEHDHQVDTTLWRAPDSCSYIIPDSPNIDINYVDLYNEAFSVDMTECNPVASCKFRDEVKTEEDKDELSICYSLFIPVPIENSGCVNIDITDMEQVYSLHSIDLEVYNTTTCESIISNNIGRIDLGNQDCSYFPFLNRPHEEHQQLLSVIDQRGFCLSIALLNLLDTISIPPISENDELIDCFSVLIGLAFVSEKFEEYLEECICQTDNDEESSTQSRLSEPEAFPNKLTNSFDLDEDCFIIEQHEGIIEEKEDISDFIIDLIIDEEEYVKEQPSSFILLEFLEIDDLNFEGRVPLGFYMPHTESPNSGTIGKNNSQNVGQITIVVESNIGLVQYATLFHEAIHALDFQAHEWLQESYFTTTDSLRARVALIEGSATYFQRDYMLDQSEYAEDMLPPDRHIERFSENLAPLISKFTYSGGYNFVQQLMQKHDFTSVDQLFLNPPVSSEQILHPE